MSNDSVIVTLNSGEMASKPSTFIHVGMDCQPLMCNLRIQVTKISNLVQLFYHFVGHSLLWMPNTFSHLSNSTGDPLRIVIYCCNVCVNVLRVLHTSPLLRKAFPSIHFEIVKTIIQAYWKLELIQTPAS